MQEQRKNPDKKSINIHADGKQASIPINLIIE